MPTLNERIAALETDMSWVKLGMEDLKVGQESLHVKMDTHMQAMPSPGNGGMVISISRRTLGWITLSGLFAAGGTVAGVLKGLGLY